MYWGRTGNQNTPPSMQMPCERRAYLNDGRLLLRTAPVHSSLDRITEAEMIIVTRQRDMLRRNHGEQPGSFVSRQALSTVSVRRNAHRRVRLVTTGTTWDHPRAEFLGL